MTYILAIALTLTLIPMSVDNLWSIPIKDYDLRVNYIGAAVIMLLAAVDFLRSHSFRKSFLEFIKEKFFLYFGLMALVGLMGLWVSEHPVRSAFFWLWSMGTLIGLPILVFYTHYRFKKWFTRSVLCYSLLQALLVTVDALLCIPSGGKLHIARIYIDYYGSENTPFCRPHAGYQEPGYFCGFALLAAVLARLNAEKENSLFWKRISWMSYACLLLATVLTSSRMGWLGVSVIILLEMILIIFPGFKKDSTLFSYSKIKKQLALPAILVIFSSLFFITQWDHIQNTVGKGLTEPLKNGSFSGRFKTLKAGVDVFQATPWVGSGPGGAGAYLVKHFPHHPHLRNLTPEGLQYIRRDPLSQNLYTELLSEWGIIGTLAFFIGLCWMFIKLPVAIRWLGLASLGIIYLSSQTLPRFDLWFIISTLFVTAYFHRSKMEKST